MNNKILIVSAFPFNNKTAGQAATNSVIDELIKAGFIIDAICFSYPSHQSEKIERFNYYKEIKRNRPQAYFYQLMLFLLFPLYTRRFSFRVLFYLLKNQSNYKYIYLDFSQIFIYCLFIKNKDKLLFYVHDLFVQRYARVKKNFLKKFNLAYVFNTENFYFKRAKNILVPSIKDKRLLYHLYKKQSIAVMPKKLLAVNSSAINKYEVNLNKFAFLGAWNRSDNVQGLKWFLDNVYSLLPKELSFIIIGSNLDEGFQKFLPANFSYLGFVNDFTDFLLNSSALICPVFVGAGIKFKVLNGLSNGCRVIGTPVAFEGVEVNLPGNFFECKTAFDFVEAITFCTNSNFKREKILKEYTKFMDRFETVSNLLSLK